MRNLPVVNQVLHFIFAKLDTSFRSFGRSIPFWSAFLPSFSFQVTGFVQQEWEHLVPLSPTIFLFGFGTWNLAFFLKEMSSDTQR